MVENQTFIPGWEATKLSEELFPQGSRILCQTKISEEYLMSLLQDNENNMFFVLFDMNKNEGVKVKEQADIKDVFRRSYGPKFHNMFFFRDSIYIFYQSGQNVLVELGLSQDYKTILKAESDTYEFNNSICGAIFHRHELYFLTYEMSGNLFAPQFKCKLVTIDLETLELTKNETNEPFPKQRQGFCTAIYGDKMFLFGGEDSKKPNQVFTDIWVLDLNFFTWRDLTPKLSFFEGFGSEACVHQGKIYLFAKVSGGRTKTSENFFEYDIVSDTWHSNTADQKILNFEATISIEKPWATQKPPLALNGAPYKLIPFGNKFYLFCQNLGVFSCPMDSLSPKKEEHAEEQIKTVEPKNIEEDNDLDQRAKEKILFKDRPFPDITFKVDQKEIPAHRAVLYAGSRFFRNMFKSGMEESTKNVIEIPDIKAPVFEALLEYIYCTTVTLNRDIVWDLFIEADKYSLPGLKKVCEGYLIQNITAENVFHTISFVEKYEAVNLRQAALRYVARNYEKVFENEGAILLKHSTLLDILRMKA